MIGAVVLLGIVVALVFYSQQDMQRAEDAKTVHSTELIPMDSIAILPFANLTTAVETGFFAEGLAEDIIDNLAQNKGLKVASRSASFQFKEYGQDPSIIGENLKVAYLLQGSVRRQGETLRITVQLIRTDNGFHVWSKHYERKLADGFEMQTAVAANVAYITEGKLRFDIFKNSDLKTQDGFNGIDPIAVKHYLNAAEENLNFRLGIGGD